MIRQLWSFVVILSFIILIMSNKNSGARLELKKFNKETKESKPEEKSPKPIVE